MEVAPVSSLHNLDDLWHGRPVRIHVREFSCVISLLLLIIAGYSLLKGGEIATGAALFITTIPLLLLGYLTPGLLTPIWKAWMSFAEVLGAVMTFVIMGAAWVIMLIPISMLLRLLSKRVMDLDCYSEGVQSYWEEREDKLHNFELLERQY